MKYVGVDACKKGWFVVAISQHHNWDVEMFPNIDELWKAFQKTSLILIDIPIGLPSSGKRLCDIVARKILNRRASSVFPVPCRKAIKAKSYREACQINQKILGKKLSVQSWNISGKISEVDDFLSNNEQARNRIRESHPEICFWALSGGIPMKYRKKNRQGFLERWRTLQTLYPQSEKIAKAALLKFPLSRMSNDPKLQDVANVIESTICQFDEKQNNNLDDNIVLRIIELLLDKHYFNDEKIAYKNKLEEEGANSIDQAINEELKNPSSEDLSKILGTIYRSVKRHTSGHREYLDFIHDHVGIRLGKGARLIRKFFKK